MTRNVLKDGASPVLTGKAVKKTTNGISVVRDEIDSHDAKIAKLEAAEKGIKDEIRALRREDNEAVLDALTNEICLLYEKLTNRIVLNDETEHKRVRETSAKILGFGARNRTKAESDGYDAVGRNIAKVVGDL